MTDINYPKSLTDGTDAYGSHVMDNFNEVKTVVEGDLENANLKSGAGISTDRMADLAITEAKIASDAVTENKLKDDEVTAPKLAEDTAGAEGRGCNLSELFSEAGEATITNVITGRAQHGGKTVWAYFYLAPGGTITLDDSIDYRYRMIKVSQSHRWDNVFYEELEDAGLPGGASDEQVDRGQWTADGSGGVATLVTDYNSGIMWSDGGQADPGQSKDVIVLKFREESAFDAMAYWVDIATGYLKATLNASSSKAEDHGFIVKIDCSPSLGTNG